MDGWKTILSFWEGRRSNFRGHILLFKTNGITEPVVKFQHCPYGKSGGRNWIDTATNLWTCIDPIIDCKEIVHELYSQLHQLHPPKTWMDTQNDGLEKLVPVEWVGHFWYIDMLDPIVSMYGTFGYMYHKNQPNVGIYTIHGSYGDLWGNMSYRPLWQMIKKPPPVDNLGGDPWWSS